MSLPALAVVGTGPVGCGVAHAYAAAGGRVTAVLSRDAARAARVATACGAARGTSQVADLAGARFVLVAVPDRAVAAVGSALLEGLADVESILCHTSGALPSTALGADTARVGSLHPLQSFPAPCGEEPLDAAVARLAAGLEGAHWFHEGAGRDEAGRVVKALGGTFHALSPGSKALYHAGAAVLSNHTVALFAMALDLFERAGLSRDESAPPLATLLQGTVRNIGAIGVPAALTGPVARGDVPTVEAHLAALDTAAPHLRPAYAEMALRAVEVAVAKGSLDAATAERLRRVLRP